MGTTSTVTLTRTQLIQKAFKIVGIDSPSAAEMADAVLELNTLIKLIDVEGRWLWCVSHTPSTLTTVASQASYTVSGDSLANDILDVETVHWMQSSTDSIPLTVFDATQAQETGLRDDTGQPVAVYLEKRPVLANQKLWVYPTPSTAYNMEYYYRRRLYDFTAASDNPDFPAEWVNVLKKRLARELALQYGLPLAERQDLRLEANEAMRKVNAVNAEEPPTQEVKTIYY